MLSGTAVAIAAGRGFGCALLSGGSVSCWGFNGAGMLGDQSALNEATPVAVFGLTNTVIAVAAGHGDACALYVSGGMACWGDNYYGEIGDGTNTNDFERGIRTRSHRRVRDGAGRRRYELRRAHLRASCQ